MSSPFEITPEFMYEIWVQRAAVVAGYTLLVYDYFLTLGDEVEYIWNTPWTPVKLVHLTNRYVVLFGYTLICIQATGFVAAITGGCEFYAIFLGVYIVISLETSHVLVVLRAWAIWGGDRRVLRSVVAAYVASLASIVAAVSKGEDFSNFEPTVTSVCYRPVPDRAWLFYFASLVVDSLMFCLTMSGLWSYRRTLNNGSLKLIQALMRGATAFYVVNVCFDILGIVSWTRYQSSPTASAIPAIMTPVLAISSQRVVHDFRQLAPRSWCPQELSLVINQQLGEFQSWPKYADEAAPGSMVLEGNSELASETSSSIDEFDIEIDDNGQVRWLVRSPGRLHDTAINQLASTITTSGVA
ncbi:hypothetical protein BKA82DRAFT_1001464 [Pisolithus tinctorius]|uniref:DUF6533 domain-containing protein n=1 Tax=Pisolithus tinctorius Marx 270 TaxID=870435 RepID=A0A0C3J366_PISTI|nr:hypothetical protein BKA82DRAFT_1001464 [Pisolithus tinctorius]KIO03523.1 hypothetical protein M404DRAFT_1001464 [Pisolithus tinctorius Marx 270]